MAQSDYIIVEFEDGIEFIPMIWVSSDKKYCHWPPYKTQLQFERAAKNMYPVEKEWGIYPITRILGEARSFERAKQKAQQAMYRSDLNTEDTTSPDRQKLRRRRKTTIIESSETEIDDSPIKGNVPPFPPAAEIESKEKNEPGAGTSNIPTRKLYISTPNSNSNTPKTRTLFSRSEPGSASHSKIGFQSKGEFGTKLQPAINNNNTESVMDLKKRIAELNLKVDIIIENQKQILDVLLNHKEDNEEIAQNVMSAFPIRTEEDLNRLEENLASEKKYADQLRKEFQKLATGTVKGTVFKIMASIFSNEIGEKFSLLGKKKKKAFVHLRIYNIILQSVRSDPRASNTTNKEIEDPIQSWLRHASARRNREFVKTLDSV